MQIDDTLFKEDKYIYQVISKSIGETDFIKTFKGILSVKGKLQVGFFPVFMLTVCQAVCRDLL